MYTIGFFHKYFEIIPNRSFASQSQSNGLKVNEPNELVRANNGEPTLILELRNLTFIFRSYPGCQSKTPGLVQE